MSSTDGLLDLRFVAAPDGRTRLGRRDWRFPLRTTAPMYLDPSSRDMAYIYVQNPTGGVFPGDRLETRLVLDAGARVHLTTQAATKVYGMNDGSALQSIDATLAAGSYLELVPDLLIPHAGSRFVQKLDVSMAQDAGFFMAEAVAPGRLARGERFEYAVVDLRTRVLDGDRNELVVDALRLEPASRLPDSARADGAILLRRSCPRGRADPWHAAARQGTRRGLPRDGR